MATVVLNLDNSDSLVIKYRKGQTLDIGMNFFEADNVTPLVIGGSVVMAVSEQPNSGKVVKTLVQGDGLTVVSNQLTIVFSILSPFLFNPIYYWDIKNIKADGKIWYLSKGVFIMNKNITV